MQDINPLMPNHEMPLDDGLRLVSYCPVCHYPYNPLEAKIVDESDGAHLIHVRCRRCRSAILALVMANQLGVSSVGLITDLDSQEILKFKESSRIGGDDVLSIYRFLGDHELEVEKL